MDHASESNFLDEDYEEARWREKPKKSSDLPIEYWTIQKLIQFMKIGNPVVTNACLCCIRDYDLTQQLNQRAIFSIGGLETIVNLCKSNDLVCRFGALYVLREMAKNIDMRRYMIDMNIIESLCMIVSEPLNDIKCLTIDILGILANIKPARQIIHESTVVSKIIDAMNFDNALLLTPATTQNEDELVLTEKQTIIIDLAIAAARALAKLCLSEKILNVVKKCGIILSLRHLLQTVHVPLVRAVMHLCNVCSHDIVIQLGLETELIIVDVVKKLKSKDPELLIDACGILSKCAQSPQTSKFIQSNKGLESIVYILSNEDFWSNVELIHSATAAAYTCALHRENAERFNEFGVLPLLNRLLSHGFNDEILTNICCFVAELLFEPKYVKLFLKNETLLTILEFFYIENDGLRIANCRILTKICKYPEYAKQLREMDGIIFLWSLLKSQNSCVQLASSNALCEYLQNDQESAEYLRKLDNGLEIVASSLKSKNETTLIAMCSLIAEIAKDSYNLAILTQYNVVPLLAELIVYKSESLQEKAAAAIASCTPYGENAKHFGELKVVRLIVDLVGSKYQKVQRAAVMALEKLSAYSINAILIHQSGVVPILLEDIHSNDTALRNAAANCLRNLRELTLEAEKFLMMKI